MNSRLALLLILLLSCHSALAEYVLEVIELKGRTAEEVIPMIRPFAGPEGTVTGMGNQIIIRTTPERLLDIATILEQIDRPPRRLMIYVRQGLLRDSDRERIAAEINAGGEHVRIEAGEPAPEDSVRLRARTIRTQSDLDTLQHVQTLEGKPAFIATGKAIPIPEQSTYIAGGVVHQQQTLTYREATTGFYVAPYLHEDRVTLRISPHMEQQGEMGETFDIQQADTTLSGRLGEWIAVGGVEKDLEQEGSGILRRSSTTSREERQIFLRVEELK